MELHKLSHEDVVGYDTSRLFEVEKEIRRELAMMSMDIYSADGKAASKKVALKKNLARVLTVKNGKTNTTTKVK